MKKSRNELAQNISSVLKVATGVRIRVSTLTQSAFGGISSAECVLCNHGTSLKSVSAYNPVEINTSLFTVYNFIAWRLCMELLYHNIILINETYAHYKL